MNLIVNLIETVLKFEINKTFKSVTYLRITIATKETNRKLEYSILIYISV